MPGEETINSNKATHESVEQAVLEIGVTLEDELASQCTPSREYPRDPGPLDWGWPEEDESSSWIPGDGGDHTGTPGSSWYQPPTTSHCGCGPEGSSYSKYLNLIVVASTNKKFSSLFQKNNSLFISQLGNSPPGVSTQKYNINGFNSRTPTTIVRKQVTRYQFEQRFNFTLPENIEDLTVFSYLGLDIEAINNDYGTNLSFADSIQSPISVVDIYSGGKPSHTPDSYNKRFHSIDKCLIRSSTTGVVHHLALNQQKATSSERTIPANRFWITRNDQKSNTTFFAFDRRTLLRNNSLIRNLRDSSIYDSGIIEEVVIEKIDISNSQMNKLLVATAENSNRIFTPRTQTKNFEGAQQPIASITQLPLNKNIVRFIKFDDFTPSPDEFKYLVTFTFQDPSVKYLKNSVSLLQQYITSCSGYYGYISEQRSLSKNKNVDIDAGYIKSIIPRIARLVDLYAELLVNFGGQPCTSKQYLASLANPTASAKNHDIFIKITSSLLETLMRVSDNLSINIDILGKTSSNSRSSTQKQKTQITKQFYSKTIQNVAVVGYDYLTSNVPKNANTTERASIEFSSLDMTPSTIGVRGKQELLKFWDNLPTDDGSLGQLVRNAKFVLTPNVIVGGEEQVNLTKIEAYNDLFFKKINSIPSALEGRLLQDSLGYVDNSDMDLTVSIVGPNFDTLSENPTLKDSEDYLEGNGEFISGNMVSYANDEVAAATQEIIQIFGANGQNEFEANFKTTNTPPDMSKDINSILKTRSFESFPPSYQAYLRRDNPKSKFSTQKERYDDMSTAENSAIINNFMNAVGTVQYLEMGTNLAMAQWKTLDDNILNSQRFIFCRILTLQDNELNIGSKETPVFKQYFTISNKNTKPRGIRDRRVSPSDPTTQRNLESATSERTSYSNAPKITFIGL
jgi:hypothetical protein